MLDILIDIPPRVLGQVQWALARLHAWNDVLTQARRAEAIGGDHGRYEYEIRYGSAGSPWRMELAQGHQKLAKFEALVLANGIDPEAVYAALGGKPVLLEEGSQVQEWRPSHSRQPR